MLDVHIDEFFKDTAVALLNGLQQFPTPKILFIDDICGPDDMDEFGLHSPRYLAALGAVQWLKDEGFVRFGVIDRQESVDEFVLTGKAFSRLIAQIPEQNQAVFEALYHARSEGTSTEIRALIRGWIIRED